MNADDTKVVDAALRKSVKIVHDGELADDGLWCVCWASEIYDDDGVTIYAPFAQYRGEPVPRKEAERRMAWGKRTYPTVIYWLERA